ncbi:unnamed protein product [Rhizophagus irregularis]|nr:unnamed protein product [Rhizophagus irregularis]CAB4430944.1 unnamed protein product [Rhizophagus irregularis]
MFLTNDIESTILVLTSNYIFPISIILSGIVTIFSKTYWHTFIYIFVDIINILHLNSSDTNNNYLLYLSISFYLPLVLMTFKRKKKESFNIIRENIVKTHNLKKAYFNYNMQKVLCHMQIIVAFGIHVSFNILLIEKIPNYDYYILYSLLQLIPCFFMIIFAFTMIEGVRRELKHKMIFVYLFNLAFCVFHLYAIIRFLIIINGSMVSIINTLLTFVPFLITVITIINSIICHRNFKKGLKIYLNYEPQTFKEVIKYDDDLDQCYKKVTIAK